MVPRGHLWFSDPVKRFEANLISNLYRTAYFAILATMYWAGEQIGHYKNQTLEAERDRLRAREDQLLTQAALAETRNAYLQQQMNPHMLFNSLNFIYNRVDRYDPVAGESVLLLSDIMRYCLEAAGEDGKAHLEEEIIQIHNLIKINEKRYDEPLNLHLNIAGDFGRYRIIPLVLFSLVENLFKHGNLKSKPNSAILTITVNQDGQLHYFSKNLKRAPSGFKRSKTLGLKNIRTRLDYAYKNNYELTLRDLTDSFETDLVVSL
jgi:LytS/YehU family sensor histidine kinase